MDNKFLVLVVTGNPDSSWIEMVLNSLAPIGDVHLALEQKVTPIIQTHHFDLAIIDTSTLKQPVPNLVKFLLDEQENLPILVVTTSPTWQRARAVFLAGASDYVRRTFDEKKMQSICQNAISRRKVFDETNYSFSG